MHSDKSLDSRFRGNDKEKEWIPACAGMTREEANQPINQSTNPPANLGWIFIV